MCCSHVRIARRKGERGRGGEVLEGGGGLEGRVRLYPVAARCEPLCRQRHMLLVRLARVRIRVKVRVRVG